MVITDFHPSLLGRLKLAYATMEAGFRGEARGALYNTKVEAQEHGSRRPFTIHGSETRGIGLRRKAQTRYLTRG